jgi:hypothetical protein
MNEMGPGQLTIARANFARLEMTPLKRCVGIEVRFHRSLSALRLAFDS